MSQTDDERLFLSFRSDGDTAALARLFDRSAPEILAIARHLTGDREDAEDLVQATFLTAIEKAARFEEGRRVRPWLVGILIRHAREQRRRRNPNQRAETYDARRLAPPATRDPGAEAEERELHAEVDRAIESLPPRYRELVEPRVRDGARGVELAERVGRRPDIVRVQLARGLARLRTLLPPGLATAILLSPASRRGLASVRARVVEHGATVSSSSAAKAVPALAGGPLVGGPLLGGLLVSHKLFVVSAAAVLVAASWWVFREADEPSPTVLTAVLAAAPPSPPSADRSGARAEPEPANEDAPEATAVAGDPGDPWSTLHARVTGRIVVAGAPLSGIEVSLLRVEDEVFERSADPAELLDIPDAPFVERSTTTTDAEGRFALDRMRTAGVHALGVDLGGPYASLRAIAESPATNATLDLGDVELGPVTAFSGRLVDEDGEPVSGVRVLAVAAPLPVPLSAVGGEHLRPDSLVFEGSGPARRLPWWLEDWWDRLPIPSDRSDAEGRFRIDGVARGVITLVAHGERFVSAARAVPSGVAAERDIGEWSLERGRVLRLRLVEANGEPVSGADVRVGPRSMLGGVTVTARVGSSDDAGELSLDALPEFADLVAVVRGRPDEAWSIHELGDVEESVITLSPRASIVVEVVDPEGERITPDELFVTRYMALDAFADPASPGRREATLDEDGRYRVDGLPVGRYHVVAVVDGVRTLAFVKLEGHDVEVRATCRPERELRVRVLAAAGGRPVESARVMVRPYSPISGNVVHTDARGEATLRLSGSPDSFASTVRVEHPEWGVTERDLHDGDEVVFELSASGRLEGRVAIAGAAPAEPMLVVAYLDDFFLFPRSAPIMATTDARGDFTLPLLAPDGYVYRVYPSFLDGDAIANMAAVYRPPEAVATGEFVVESGETTRLDINAVTADSAIACRMVGRVNLDGAPKPEVRVSVGPSETAGGTAFAGARSRRVETDATGAFELSGIAPGRVNVVLTLVDEQVESHISMRTIYSDELTLSPGSVKRLDLDLRTMAARFSVRGASGDPAWGADVAMRGVDGANRGFTAYGSADNDGRLELPTYRTGRYRVEVYSSLFGAARTEVTLPHAGVSTIELDPGVPCAGTIRFPEEWRQQEHLFPWMYFRYERDGRSVERRIAVWKKGEFDIAGLPAGPIDVVLGVGQRRSEPVRVHLPDGGDRSLELVFR